jgi:hypothetical protein
MLECRPTFDTFGPADLSQNRVAGITWFSAVGVILAIDLITGISSSSEKF